MATPHAPHCETLLRTKPFMQHADGAIWGQCRGYKKSENAIRTTLLRLSVMRLTSDKPLRCKGMQRIAKYGNMISRGVGDIWQSFQIGGYECIKREYVTSIKEALLLFSWVGFSVELLRE